MTRGEKALEEAQDGSCKENRAGEITSQQSRMSMRGSRCAEPRNKRNEQRTVFVLTSYPLPFVVGTAEMGAAKRVERTKPNSD